jgi:diadenosine tetraphosphatase ApaH/serine/threonine PP2A family protein phosphatase
MRGWMAGLPVTLHFDYARRRFRVVHGGTTVINRWVFQSERDVLTEEVALSGADITLAGHSGVPYVARVGRRVWFNPGVIGVPANDGTADVWYGLIRKIDSELLLSTHRLTYDHHAAAAAMRRSGHANGYARTLVTGLWPSLDILPSAEREVTGQRIRQRTMRLAAMWRTRKLPQSEDRTATS